MGRLSRSLVFGVVLLLGVGASGSGAGAEIRLSEGDVCPGVVAPVADLYRAFFLREPDAAGLDYWTRYVSSREGNLDRAADAFARSPEFLDRYGQLDNEGFIIQLYRNSFGRVPDAEGLAFWTADLDAGNRTRGQVVLFWSYSEEFLGREFSIEDFSPLRNSQFEQEVWCGNETRVFQADRLDLSSAQAFEVGMISGSGVFGEISAHSENGTIVLSSLIDVDEPLVREWLYVHPNLNQNVAYYRVTVACEDCVWFVTSTSWPPPWFDY